jgi:YD repeat-containing protein
VAGPSHGSLGAITNNVCTAGSPNRDTASVTYTPSASYSGYDSFTYQVNDGTDSLVATASLAVGGTGTTSSIGFGALVGSASTTSSGTTLTIPVTSAVAAGSTIIVGFVAGTTVSAVTDTAGNTYTLDAAAANGTSAKVQLASAVDVAALTTSDSLTITCSSGAAKAGVAVAFTGTATSGPLDQTASGTGSSQSAAVSPALTPSAAGELVVTVGGFNNAGSDTYTASNATLAVSAGTSGGGTNRSLGLAYVIQGAIATDATTVNDTTTSGTWAAAAASYLPASTSSGGGPVPVVATTTYTYDLADRLTAMTQPDGTSVAFTYDALDRVWKETAAGVTSTYGFAGASDAVVRVDGSDGTSLTSALDSSGDRLAESASGGGFGWSLTSPDPGGLDRDPPGHRRRAPGRQRLAYQRRRLHAALRHLLGRP